MLSSLRIENLAIVDELEVEFAPGLNVLTGETGAGKSIILKAIELLTGRRASAELIRSGAEKCTIEAIFHPSKESLAALDDANEELAELKDHDEILIRRTIDSSGKSKFTLNGHLATAALVQNLSQHLVDITGQHQQQFLLDSAHHLLLLDRFGVAASLLEQNRIAFSQYDEIRKRLDSLRKNRDTQESYLARLRAEHEEFVAAGLEAGGRAKLEAELSKLANTETLAMKVSQCLELLEHSDDNVDAKLRSLSHLLAEGLRLDPALSEVHQLVDSSAIQLREARLQLSQYGASLEADPMHLEQLRGKVSEIARLERKYGKNEESLYRYFQEISGELQARDGGAFDEQTLSKNFELAEAELRRTEGALRQARTETARRLTRLVEAGLQELGMKRARFEVEINNVSSSALGADAVEFILAANPGEPARALAKVASGGELSRILLVLKTILNEQDGPDTQVFDEIDVGVSGATSQVVGEKLHAVSKTCQVIIVTHSPQVAAFADRHFFIEKSSSTDRTTTQIRALSEDEQVRQIAAMLAGKKVSAPFEGSARELLALKKPRTEHNTEQNTAAGAAGKIAATKKSAKATTKKERVADEKL